MIFLQILDITHILDIQGYKGNTPDVLKISDVYYMNNTSPESTYFVYYDLNIEKTISVFHDISISSHFDFTQIPFMQISLAIHQHPW